MPIAPNGRTDGNSEQHQLHSIRDGKRKKQQQNKDRSISRRLNSSEHDRLRVYSEEEDFPNNYLAAGSQQGSGSAHFSDPQFRAPWQVPVPPSSPSGSGLEDLSRGLESSRFSSVERQQQQQRTTSVFPPPGYVPSDSGRQEAHSSTNNNSAASANCPMQSSLVHLNSEVVTQDSDRKTEGPSRKRRRMSQSVVDQASTSGHQLVRPWQNTVVGQEPVSGSMAATATHRPTVATDLCSTSGGNIGSSNTGIRRPVGRSTSVRRHSQRQRERQIRNWNHSNTAVAHSSGPNVTSDRRAFQQPTGTLNQQPSGPLTGHGNPVPFHPHLIIDLNNEASVPTSVPFSLPVSLPTYAVPLCTGHTTIPPCTTHHNPFNPSLPLGVGAHPAGHANPIPLCGVGHMPMCGMHIPGCNVQHMAMRQQSLPVFQQESLLGHHIHHPQVSHHQHHHPQQPQHHHPVAGHHGPYLPAAPPPPPHTHQARNHEVDFLHERVAFHVPSTTHPTSIFTSPSLHVVPADPYFRTAPRELSNMPQPYHRFGTYSRQRQPPIPQWRTPLAPATTTIQPSYSGWLLRYILPTPPVASGLQMELDSSPVEENYEALLNLAERLGEAKPRGLIKSMIDQLPSYRYNPDTHKSINDQTCCVVCMSDFELKQPLRVLPCSHEFHARCVDKWLKTNRTCPICRADASEYNNNNNHS